MQRPCLVSPPDKFPLLLVVAVGAGFSSALVFEVPSIEDKNCIFWQSPAVPGLPCALMPLAGLLPSPAGPGEQAAVLETPAQLLR